MCWIELWKLQSSRIIRSVLHNGPTSSLSTWPAKRNNEFCNRTYVFIRSTYVPNAKSKQATCWHTIFIPYSHARFSPTIFIESVFSKIKDSITVNSDTKHLKFNSLKFLLACNWRHLSREFCSIETFWRRDYLFTRTHTDVNSHVCEGYSGRCLFHFQCSTVNICTKEIFVKKNSSCFSSKL